MQIHELNNFTGTLGSGAYLAIDDGTDTGKISSQGLLAATEARIDNIIAGPAPSAEEIVDARFGADGVTYPSLGDAIRDQFTDVKSDMYEVKDAIFTSPYSEMYDAGTTPTANLKVESSTMASSATYTGFIMPVDPSKEVITVEKTKGTKLIIFATSAYPAVGVTANRELNANGAKIANYELQSGDKYIYCIYYDSGHDTDSEASIKATISVYYGTEQIDVPKDMLSNYISDEVSINLFDKSTAVKGYYMNRSGVLNVNNNQFYNYVKLNGAGTYRFYGNSTLFGTNQVKSIPMYDAEKNYIQYITGSHFGDGTGTWYGVEFTITDSNISNDGYAYFVLSQHKDNLDRIMVVKDIAYPSEYTPYYNRKLINTLYTDGTKVKGGRFNPLFGKTAIFFGDSICAGDSAEDDKDGYAGRIGDGNSMGWYNYGVSGATIVSISGHHNILADLDSALIDFPNADYVILEGGTNDADNLGLEGIGTFDADDYSGSYDTTTFSGAFETILYKAVTYWKTAQIGYVVAQKMGTNSTARAKRHAYFERAMALCKKWGVPYINLWDETKLNSYLSAHYDSAKTASENIASGNLYTDGQHLTPTGYEVITPFIDGWMRNI